MRVQEGTKKEIPKMDNKGPEGPQSVTPDSAPGSSMSPLVLSCTYLKVRSENQGVSNHRPIVTHAVLSNIRKNYA